MKLLDKAIINRDVDYLVKLIKDNVDCEGAVLVHLKDQLVPKHFSEKELEEKGVILKMDGLDGIIQGYINKSRSNYRQETYVKRIYLTLQQALIVWQLGKVSNKALDENFNEQAIETLKAQWIKDELPETLKKRVAQQQKSYIDFKYSQWQQGKMEEDEIQKLDELVLKTLSQFWHMSNNQNDTVVTAIRSTLHQEAVNYFRAEKEEDIFVRGMREFLYKQVIAQIYDGSINSEAIKENIEAEKRSLLKGKVVSDNMPVYKKATSILLEKWRKNALEPEASSSVTQYVESRMRQYNFPGQFKSILLERALQSLLKRYKSNTLDEKLCERLNKHFESNVVGYYDKHAEKETEFRSELANVIFSDVLADWKAKDVEESVDTYLRTSLLKQVQDMIVDLSKHVSRSAAYVSLTQKLQGKEEKLSQLEGKVQVLEKMLETFMQEKKNSVSDESKLVSEKENTSSSLAVSYENLLTHAVKGCNQAFDKQPKAKDKKLEDDLDMSDKRDNEKEYTYS